MSETGIKPLDNIKKALSSEIRQAQREIQKKKSQA